MEKTQGFLLIKKWTHYHLAFDSLFLFYFYKDGEFSMPLRQKYLMQLMALSSIVLVGLVGPTLLSADELLQKKMGPFIGKWSGQSQAFGGFEGTTGEGRLDWNVSFRWVPGKHAVEQKWQVTYVGSQKNFSSGTEILYKDVESGDFKVISSGMDGDVAWSNHGTVKWVKRGLEISLQEQTVNGTQSAYVVRRVKESREKMMLSMPSRVVDGKELGEVEAFPLERNPFAATSQKKLAESFFEYLLSDPEKLRPILHSEFQFTYMGKIEDTRLPYGVPYETEDFLNKWLPHVPELVPDGIELKTLQMIASNDGVAVVQKGDAKGKYGRYDNDYVWIFNFKEGKILSVEEYNSDYLVATRLYGQKLLTPKD